MVAKYLYSLFVGLALFGWHGVLQAQESDASKSDVSMMMWNFSGPFVNSEYAQKYAKFIMEQKYPGVVLDPAPSSILDKGDRWAVTVLVIEWPKFNGPAPDLTAKKITWQIRKSDAAVLEFR